MERIIRIKNTVGIAHIMMIFRGYVSIQRQMIEQILLIQNTDVAVGRAGRITIMASENKKNKAKNSPLINGADKEDCRMKRVMYYTKRDRNKLKKIDFGE